MKINQGSWVMVAACVLALAACKKSAANTGGTGGMGTGGVGTGGVGTGGVGTGGMGAAGMGTGGSKPATGGTGGMGTGGMGTGGMGTGGAAGGTKTAVANITGFMGGMVTGTATFKQEGMNVTVTVMITAGCQAAVMGGMPVHIHEGKSCADAMMQGAHWGMTRGEGIPNVVCTGTTGTATLTRMPTDPALAWTIGGADATNIVGHAFVVHGMAAASGTGGTGGMGTGGTGGMGTGGTGGMGSGGTGGMGSGGTGGMGTGGMASPAPARVGCGVITMM